MRTPLRRFVRLALAAGTFTRLALFDVAPAEGYMLQLHEDVGGAAIITVDVNEISEPKGLRYTLTTTLGDGAGARTYHTGVTRKGDQWVVDSFDGLPSGPIKKIASIEARAGGQVAKRFRSWAKLAQSSAEHDEILARGKQVQAEMKAEGREMAATLNATISFSVEDLAVAQLAYAVRYYAHMYATLDAVSRLGIKDKKGVDASMRGFLDTIYPPDDVGRCTAPNPYLYRMDSQDCPPDDFVPFSSVPPSSECYGRKGLFQNQDFQCSPPAPQGTVIMTPNGWVPVSFGACCLEHDRAFFCGGLTSSGEEPGASAGSRAAWHAVNTDLVHCIGRAINAAYIANGTAPHTAIRGLWMFLFAQTSNTFIWTDSTLVGDAWNNGYNSPYILNERRKTCLCGGTKPVPLCGKPCRVNQCTAPLPDMLDLPAFENVCNNTCVWTCVEEYENGRLVKRYKRKRLYDAQGDPIDTPGAMDFSNCTPSYEMDCECVPYERPTPLTPNQCQISSGFFQNETLPTSQNVYFVDP